MENLDTSSFVISLSWFLSQLKYIPAAPIACPKQKNKLTVNLSLDKSEML